MTEAREQAAAPAQPDAARAPTACRGCCGIPANAWVANAIARGRSGALPFRHWLIDSVLPPALLPGLPPSGDASAPAAMGRRETVNASRHFLNKEAIAADPGAASLADAFDNCGTRRSIAALSGADLAGTDLRIEYAADRDGFWLEPHTDILAKRLTLLVFLSQGPGSDGWGTDLYDGQGRPVHRVASSWNDGLLFVPAADTWHGFERRPIEGTRRTLIINYVDKSWRNRHELVRG